MAERVHPHPSSDSLQPSAPSSVNSGESIPPPSKNPPPGTYVIQLPKDQVYRVPPPENAERFNLYSTRQSNHRCSCRRFLCWTLLLVTVLLLLFAIASGLLFLILQPVSPRFSILAMTSLSLSMNSSISPEFNITVRAENPNEMIGIYYEKKSNVTVTVYFSLSDAMLCGGALPAFYQASRSARVVTTKVKGSGIKLRNSVKKAMKDSEKEGKVRLKVDVRAPIRLKVYSVKSWTITMKVSCNVWVKKLMAEDTKKKTMMVENYCAHSVNLW